MSVVSWIFLLGPIGSIAQVFSKFVRFFYFFILTISIFYQQQKNDKHKILSYPIFKKFRISFTFRKIVRFQNLLVKAKNIIIFIILLKCLR